MSGKEESAWNAPFLRLILLLLVVRVCKFKFDRTVALDKHIENRKMNHLGFSLLFI